MSRFRRLLLIGILAAPALAAAQQPFQTYIPFEGAAGETRMPPDYDVPGELVVGRLMYPGGGGNWLRGGTSWTVDYPKGDRTLAALLRRFTRAEVRSVEQPVNLDVEGDVYYWPFLIVGLAGNWDLTDHQVEELREYLLRGGFLFSDSFFGSNDWIQFSFGLNRVFPDRPIVDVLPDHPIFHTVYDLSEIPTTQIPHMGSLLRGGGGWLSDGRVPRWSGIEDEEGRLMVLIAHNNDVADSWQWADDPRYPADKANLGLKIGVNIAVYMMTH